MDIEGRYRIAERRDIVWAALNDASYLQRCIPGCESLERLSDTELHATIRAVIGPVKAPFDTRITLEDLNPPESYRLVAEAKSGTAGFGRGGSTVTLTEEEGGTLLHYTAHFTVGGRLAQVGSRLVLGVTRKMADEFFGNFSRDLDEEAVALHRQRPPGGAFRGSRLVLAGAALALALLIWWFLLR